MGAQSKTFARACATLAVAMIATVISAAAQSSLLEAPTPVTGNEIAGRIPALDLGDARLTRHFYTLNARPGDLELTFVATNLEGDIDLFSAASMRPLTKVTLYGGSETTVARTVFFRRDETLILRVQARSASDADGAYRIRFGGTFVASTAPAPDESARPAGSPAPAPAAGRNSRGSYRVNSIGARIDEPKPEIAAASPSPTPDETTTAREPAPPRATTSRTNTPRNRAARREPARRDTARRAETPAQASDADKSEAAKTETTERAAATTEKPRAATSRAGSNRARPDRTRAPRAGSTDRSAASANTPPAETPAAAEPATGAAAPLGLEAPGSRLVLELRDGTRIVREMSEVRRVAIEGRLVVVVLKSGRTERQPLSNIQRMTIEP
ncbi:MAG: hypothetical protein ABR554_04795 [Pyrinomonadaceae bacterium]